MLVYIAAATLSCAGVPELSPPERGALFAQQTPVGTYFHEQIVSTSRSGAVTVRAALSPEPQINPAALATSPNEFVSFMGMILVENGAGENYRRRSLPADLLDRVNALQVGETLAFDVRHDTRLGGQSRRFTETHAITFLGCGTADTQQGTVQTRRFEVDTAGLVGRGGDFQVRRTRKRVDIAVGYGWVAYNNDGGGAMMLSRASVGR